MSDSIVGIPNAPHWLNHSHVTCREDYTAADDAWVQARMFKVGIQGSGSNLSPDMQVGKPRGVLQVERMVVPGSVVAVMRRNGRVKTVNLPQEADQLLIADLNYLITQMDELFDVMPPEEQRDFLPGANGHSETSLSPVK